MVLSLMNLVVVGAVFAQKVMLQPFENTANENERKYMLAQKLKLLEKMVYSSPLSKRIKDSANPVAVNLLTETQHLYQLAGTSVLNGELDRANELISQAFALTGKVSKMVSDTQRHEKIERTRYEALHEQSKSYLVALEVLVDDQDDGPGISGPDINRLELRIKQAVRYADDGKLVQANEIMRAVVAGLERGLIAVRQSMTLVSKFEFESPTDEFIYKFQNYFSHRTLVDLLIKKRDFPASRQKFIDQRVALSLSLKNDAEASANNGNYEEAISKMDNAINELVRVLRISGLNML